MILRGEVVHEASGALPQPPADEAATRERTARHRLNAMLTAPHLGTIGLRSTGRAANSHNVEAAA